MQQLAYRNDHAAINIRQLSRSNQYTAIITQQLSYSNCHTAIVMQQADLQKLVGGKVCQTRERFL